VNDALNAAAAAAAAVHYCHDPADWVTNADLFEYFACNLPEQNCDVDFMKSARKCGEEKVGLFRYFKPGYFVRVLKNGEKVEREWLVYSVPSSGQVFCYVCELFASTAGNSLGSNPFQTGFDYWKNVIGRFVVRLVST